MNNARHSLPLQFLAACQLLLAACQPPPNEYRVVGVLESDRVELTVEFSEAIVERGVLEGAAVSQGDIVIVQDSSRAEARLREGEALLSQTEARLDELTRGPRQEQILASQAVVDGAVKELQFRRTEFERLQMLLDRNLTSPDARDRAKAAQDNASASLKSSRAKLDELLSGTTVEELDQARAAVRQVEAQLDQLRINAHRHMIISPVDGVVDSLLFEVGERPPLGKPVAILLTGTQPFARVYVPEAIRVSIAPGRVVTVHVDGLPEPLPGRVRWIASDAAFTPYFALTERDRGRLTYLAKIDIDLTGRRLPDGVPVEVEL